MFVCVGMNRRERLSYVGARHAVPLPLISLTPFDISCALRQYYAQKTSDMEAGNELF